MFGIGLWIDQRRVDARVLRQLKFYSIFCEREYKDFNRTFANGDTNV
jgi:hypothetical protein